MPGLKAKLARAFLAFLDEHGGYRTQLEEAAVRAAAAEANSLFARDRHGRKKKRRRGSPDEGGRGEAEEEVEEIAAPPKFEQLPEDPYEQIQFYFRTFTQRTKLQVEERLEHYRARSGEWVHSELHHPARVPISSGSMLAATVLLWAYRARSKRIAGLARAHGILGKKLELKEYLHPDLFRGRILLRYSIEGRAALDKITEKADKAEVAALASMRPYQRKKYERFCRLERVGERILTACLILSTLASGTTLVMSLNSLYRGDSLAASRDSEEFKGLDRGERLDGHIYSLDGPMDSDGYPIGMRESAEEKFAACLSDAEEQGIEDPTIVCDIEAFFDESAARLSNTTLEEAQASTLRGKINCFLTTKLRFSPLLADYLSTLRTQTLAYLSSLLAFLLFLASHSAAHKMHLATAANDPMKHFVLSATDKSVKADGTVEAKRGETEAQRKRRERMLQAERNKARMAQLAMEAKQRVAERRRRLEGEAAAERKKEEQQKKVAKEQEEIVKMHGKQFMMLKAGVPEGAIKNSLQAEGIEDDQAKEVVEKLKAIKVRMAEELRKKEEEEAKKAEEEKKREEEKERIAQARLKMMKSQKITHSNAEVGTGGSWTLAERRRRLEGETAAEREKEDQGEEVAEEQEEILKIHGRQFMMLKAGVPEGAIMNSLQAEGIEDDEAKEIIEELKAFKVRRAEEARKKQEAKKAEEEKRDKEHCAQTSLKMLKFQKTMRSNVEVGTGGSQTPSLKSSDDAVSTGSASKGSTANQIGQGDLKTALEHKVPKYKSNPAPWPVNPAISNKRCDRESHTWVDAAIATNRSPGDSSSKDARETPKKSNMAEATMSKVPSNLKLGGDDSVGKENPADGALPGVTSSPRLGDGMNMAPRLKLTGKEEEEKKGEDQDSSTSYNISESAIARKAKEAITAAVRLPFAELETVAAPEPVFVEAPATNGSEHGDDNEDSKSDDSPLVLVRASSPQDGKPQQEFPVPVSDPFHRSSLMDIRAQIAAIFPKETDEGTKEEDEGEGGEEVDLSPAWLHSPAFETALRDSNASWDRRPTSRDIMGRIREVQRLELQAAEKQQQAAEEKEKEARQQQAQRTTLTRSRSRGVDDSLAIIDEQCKHDHKIDHASAFEFKPKASKSNAGYSDDDEISELSETTFVSNTDGQRSIPQSLFVPSSCEPLVPMSPMVMSVASALSPSGRKSFASKDNMERMIKMAEREFSDLPAPLLLEEIDEKVETTSSTIPATTTGAATTASSPAKSAATRRISKPPPTREETEEEKKRRERAEARAKKIEAITARRNAGEDVADDESAVSGINKRRSRIRKKKQKKEAEALAATAIEENSIKTDDVSQFSEDTSAATPRVEPEEAKRRKKRAAARATKLAAMAARRNVGKHEDGDDASMVSGITKRHRMRRKKSMLAAISPEERARNQFKRSVYSCVLGAERAQWRGGVYAHVMRSQSVRTENVEKRRRLEMQSAAVRRRLANQRRLDQKAKKIAARAERFHKMRRGEGGVGEGDDDDEASVVSSTSRRRRRRTRKSVMLKAVPALVEEAPAPKMMTAEEKEKKERDAWCHQVYVSIMQADQNRWKKTVYSCILDAQTEQKKRIELEALVEKDRAVAQALKEKKRRQEARAMKMEQMSKLRREGGTINEDNGSVVSSTSRMRRRRGRKSLSHKLAPVAAVEEKMALTTLLSVSRSMTAEEKEKQVRETWCLGIFVRVIKADQNQWKKHIYRHVLGAEKEKMKHLKLEAQIEKDRAAAGARKEKERRHEARAKKMKMISKLRQEGVAGDEDNGSIGSPASRIRRRRRRKSVAHKAFPVNLGEKSLSSAALFVVPKPMTLEEKEKQARVVWCEQFYFNVMRADQNSWKRLVYSHILNAEDVRRERQEKQACVVWCKQFYFNVMLADQNRWKRLVYSLILKAEDMQKERVDLESQLERKRIAAETRREKEHQNELRAKKMERMQKLRNEEGARDGDEASVVSAVSRMRRRRARKSTMRRQATAPSATRASVAEPAEEAITIGAVEGGDAATPELISMTV